MKQDILTTFLNQNKDILLLKNRNNTIVAGPEYCLFRTYLKEILLSNLSKRYPSIKFIELSLPSSVNNTQLVESGYSKNFELLNIEKSTRSLRPEIFATTYGELEDFKHFFGTEVCYYSIGTSFRNEKSTKKRVVRSFQFEQLEFQFYKSNIIKLEELVEDLKLILSTFTHDFNNISTEIKNSSELPFYSNKTIDVVYNLHNSESTLELSSLSQRNERQVVELSIGIARTFITSMIDASKNKKEVGLYFLSNLSTKFTRKIFNSKIYN